MTQPDFIIIPTQLLSDDSLQPSDRILFGYIYWMTKLALMKCVASNATLAELTGFSERQIKSSLDRLEQQGYVGRIYKGKNMRHREEITCEIAFSAHNPQSEGTSVHSRGNKRSLTEGTVVHHNKKREKENIKRTLKISEFSDLEPELTDFIEMREAQGKPLTQRALSLVIEKLRAWYPGSAQKQRKCLEQSIMNGWSSIVELKDTDKLDISPTAATASARHILHPEKYGRL